MCSTKRVFRSYTEDPVVPLGVLKVNVNYREVSEWLELFIMPGSSSPIIGREWLALLKIIRNCEKSSEVQFSIYKFSKSYEDLMEEFKDVFSDKVGTYKKLCTIEMKKDAKPIFRKARPIPFALQGKVRTKIERLVKMGALVTVDSSKWVKKVHPFLRPLCPFSKKTVIFNHVEIIV